jgi:hypothetical protein
MAEQNTPAVADELVEVDGTVRRVRIEIWSCVTQAERSTAIFCRTHLAILNIDRRVREGVIVLCWCRKIERSRSTKFSRGTLSMKTRWGKL